jgi:hypothetical protein
MLPEASIVEGELAVLRAAHSDVMRLSHPNRAPMSVLLPDNMVLAKYAQTLADGFNVDEVREAKIRVWNVDALRVDLELAGLGSGVGCLVLQRSFLAAARSNVRERPERAREMVLAAVRLSLAFDGDYSMELVDFNRQMESRGEHTIGRIIGLDGNDADMFDAQLVKLNAQLANQVVGRAVHDAFMKLLRQQPEESLDTKSLESLMQMLDEQFKLVHADSNPHTVIIPLNIMWRLRCLMAADQRAEEVRQIDAWVDEQIENAQALPHVKWLRQIQSVKGIRPTSPGHRYISDPNDPILKGDPPQ